MIDIHCHILPGIDDGPATIDKSLSMAREAVKEGIKTIIATPHHRNNMFDNTKREIVKHVDNFNSLLEKENIPLTILPGQENRIYGEIIDDYNKGEILTLSNTNYLFIEFPSSVVPRYTDRLLYDIQLEGLTPIIVHPERNKELLDKPEILYNLVKNGALTQVTAASVAGYFGKSVQKFSKQLIEYNLTHFIASDAHNTNTRSFKMKTAYELIKDQYGMEYVYLFLDNSEKLLGNENIYKEIPEPIKKRKLFGIF
ncbi:tyrosine-protein phosphatase [Bacillus sp. Au-Bac7]|uniref:tyrosine-protein phosphatase n=1 Tax=Bacillus sp. Au-Bac7 TaxID=2906458 RepID=UPI001E49F816|nr:CpsB/CapC family capsule biosynthesis tyrosine phosphatase [Bacillus sp. Au-Bac7]MCE4049563.1 tyrosine protein phosphatase [Bacillus sp. Au-Bac7]